MVETTCLTAMISVVIKLIGSALTYTPGFTRHTKAVDAPQQGHSPEILKSTSIDNLALHDENSVHLKQTCTPYRGINYLHVLIQVPANRIGHTEMDLGQLKILQEAITLTIFVPFVIFYMGQPMKLDYLWAGLCILGAVYFVFRT